MKKGLYLSVTAIMVAALLSACGASKSAETELSEKESGEEKTADAGKGDGQEVVNFWYLWGGEEGKRIEEIIDSYNKSQDRYKVVGLSTPDQQKVIAGISGAAGRISPMISEAISQTMPRRISRSRWRNISRRRSLTGSSSWTARSRSRRSTGSSMPCRSARMSWRSIIIRSCSRREAIPSRQRPWRSSRR